MAEVASRLIRKETGMSVRCRTYRDPKSGAVATRWMIDIQPPNGKRIREVCPVQTKRAAERYEQKRRIELFDPARALAPLQAAQPAPPPVEPEKEADR